MENQTVKKTLQAFVAGGLVGAATQGFMTIYSLFISDPGTTINLSLVTLGMLGALLAAAGIFPKMDEFGGMGVNVPTLGLGAASCAPILGARMEGKSKGEAFVQGITVPLKLLGIAMAIGLVTALIKLIIG